MSESEKTMSTAPVVNLDDLEYMDFGDGGRFEARLGRISSLVGARELGYNVTRVPAGKRAFPCHLHHAIEEMCFILEGEGTLRLGDDRYPLRKGDFVAFPPGPRGGHQIINSGTAELVYLAVSTLDSPDVVEYPDSDKVLAIAGDLTTDQRDLRLMVRKSSAVDYFDGESEDPGPDHA